MPAILSLTILCHPLPSPSRMAVWAVLPPLLLGYLLFQARPVLVLPASYMIVAMSTWVMVACRALCAWQGNIRQAGGGIINPTQLGQIGLMKVHSAALQFCSCSVQAYAIPGPHQHPAVTLLLGHARHA